MIYIHTHTYIYIYIYYMCVCVINIYIYIYICMYTHIYIFIYLYNAFRFSVYKCPGPRPDRVSEERLLQLQVEASAQSFGVCRVRRVCRVWGLGFRGFGLEFRV